MKKVVVALLVSLFLLSGVPAFANELGFGGLWLEGAHSDDSSYAMENEGGNGYGIAAHFDKDMGWKKQLSENNALGIDPGMAYRYIRWHKNTKESNTLLYRKGTTKTVACLSCDDYTTVYVPSSSTKTEHVNSHFGFVTLKPYWEIYKDFRLFGAVGLGYEFADDDDGDNMATLTEVGMSYMFTSDLGLSASYGSIFSDPRGDFRRFDTVVGEIVWRF